jgi:hypothetical protein
VFARKGWVTKDLIVYFIDDLCMCVQIGIEYPVLARNSLFITGSFNYHSLW